jgi:hypothetical protein
MDQPIEDGKKSGINAQEDPSDVLDYSQDFFVSRDHTNSEFYGHILSTPEPNVINVDMVHVNSDSTTFGIVRNVKIHKPINIQYITKEMFEEKRKYVLELIINLKS